MSYYLSETLLDQNNNLENEESNCMDIFPELSLQNGCHLYRI